MKLTSLLLLGQAANLALAQCANNCARAVAGTARKDPPLSERSSQCVSFLAVTVTPATSTTTEYTTITPVTLTATITDATVTETETYTTVTDASTISGVTTSTSYIATRYTSVAVQIPPRDVEKRQVTVSPSAIPAYATPCDDAAAYRAACSCGFTLTASTSTAPTPIATTVITVTETGYATEYQTSTDAESVAATTQTLIYTTSTVVVTATATLPCASPLVVRNNGEVCAPILRRSCPQHFEPDCNGVQVGCDSGCFCSRTENGYQCVLAASCSRRCSVDSECGAGEVCDTQTCCGHGVCSASDFCANPSLTAPANLFRTGSRELSKLVG